MANTDSKFDLKAHLLAVIPEGDEDLSYACNQVVRSLEELSRIFQGTPLEESVKKVSNACDQIALHFEDVE